MFDLVHLLPVNCLYHFHSKVFKKNQNYKEPDANEQFKWGSGRRAVCVINSFGQYYSTIPIVCHHDSVTMTVDLCVFFPLFIHLNKCIYVGFPCFVISFDE